MIRLTLATASTPGAVAILQLHGGGVAKVLIELTGCHDWPIRRALRCGFAGIDEGLAICIGENNAQLMPHGGPRVVQKLIEYLTSELGCVYDPQPDTMAMYPEAGSQIEADMLDAIAYAASPAAIDLLAKQPQLWAMLLEQKGLSAGQTLAIADHSRILDRLIDPPRVVVVGQPNVGKSTLTNALMGQAVSIVADLPGTTRDWVGGVVELAPSVASQAVAVHWLDTPGLRESDDRIEQRAISLASQQIEQADILIAMRDPEQAWPDTASLPRSPDLWVVNKVDSARSPETYDGMAAESPLHISAEQDRNLGRLQRLVIESLGLSSHADLPWAFSNRLRQWCSDPGSTLDGYL